MDARFCVSWQDRNRVPIPLGGKGLIGLRGQFAPKHAELKANPGNGKRRDVAVCPQGLFVGPIGRIEVAKIGQQRPKGDEILQAAGFGCIPAARIEHAVEISPARLIDSQSKAIDVRRRRAAISACAR